MESVVAVQQIRALLLTIHHQQQQTQQIQVQYVKQLQNRFQEMEQ